MKYFRRRLRQKKGQAMVEYILVAFILIIFGYGAVRGLGDALGISFKKTASIRTGALGVGP